MNKDKPVIYAFIDSQNLNLGVRSQGWKMDYKKFRLYLTNKYGVTKAYMFIGMVAGNEGLYQTLQEAGFILVFKPTVQYFEDGKETVKGNVDAELVLHAAAIEYQNYTKAIIVTGDGDFRCLVKFLAAKNKLLNVMAPNRYFSKLLREYSGYIIRIDLLKKELEYKKRRDRRSVETLGLPGHGDTKRIIAKKATKNKKKRSTK
ncbi:MAG TPA: NYN domain-containing protein [Candidatus Limnocylindria bacterium]|nr:NYN domain-containing protein [Candidatus Limnocylindria bacterium]